MPGEEPAQADDDEWRASLRQMVQGVPDQHQFKNILLAPLIGLALEHYEGSMSTTEKAMLKCAREFVQCEVESPGVLLKSKLKETVTAADPQNLIGFRETQEKACVGRKFEKGRKRPRGDFYRPRGDYYRPRQRRGRRPLDWLRRDSYDIQDPPSQTRPSRPSPDYQLGSRPSRPSPNYQLGSRPAQGGQMAVLPVRTVPPPVPNFAPPSIHTSPPARSEAPTGASSIQARLPKQKKQRERAAERRMKKQQFRAGQLAQPGTQQRGDNSNLPIELSDDELGDDDLMVLSSTEIGPSTQLRSGGIVKDGPIVLSD